MFLWLFALLPFIVIILAFTKPIQLTDGESQCASYGEVHLPWDGNSGCPYEFDFSEYVSGNCTIEDIDIDRFSGGVQHYINATNSPRWTDGTSPVIEILPNPGYTTYGLVVSCDITIYFTDNTSQDVTWTCFVDYSAGPYPDPCY